MLRVVFLTLIFLAAYYGCVSLRLFPQGGATSIQQVGIVKAAQYKERRKVPVIVTAGTSKSAKLESKFFNADTENLSVQGGVTLTGLHIVDRCSFVPSIVLVELNRMSIRSLAEPRVVKYLEKREHPFIRLVTDCRNRPIPVLSRCWQELAHTNTDSAAQKIAKEQSRAQAKMAKSWLKQIDATDHSLTKKDIVWFDHICRKIKRCIARQQKKGSVVVLFDVPMDPRAQNARIEIETNEYLRKKFPDTEYTWMDTPKQIFDTTDLVHLTPEEAQRYAAYVEGQLLKMGYLARDANSRLVATTTDRAI